VDEAREIIKNWKETFSGAMEWINKSRDMAHDPGFTPTPFGRKRRFGLLTDNNAWLAENEAGNMRVQSLASDLTLLSVLEAEPTLRKSDLAAKVINTVHDSLIIEATPEDAAEAIKRVVEIMERVPHEYLGTDIPFVADAEVGNDWGHMTEIEDVEGEINIENILTKE